MIIPLAGGSNPFWQGDWSPLPCEKSDLLRTFVHRVLDFYKIDRTKPSDGDIVVTFVDRKSSRRLLHQADYLDEIRANISHVKVQAIDFASIPFKQQLEIARSTDVFVGVHGAGLTHGMFFPKKSVIVEILPPDLDHKGFRNMAGMLGHGYFSTHASKRLLQPKNDGWQHEDVFLEKWRFLELMNTAIKSIYNSGEHNYDIN